MDIKLIAAKGLKILLNPPALRNCYIDKNASVCAKSELSNVQIMHCSYIGYNCFMVNTRIGSFCSIADRCCIGGAMHPIQRVSTSPVFHKGKNILNTNIATFPCIPTLETVIENDVWIGMGCFIKAGVTIHNGAVIGMGSIVTKDIPAYEIWAGNPARFIRKRFQDEIIDALLKIQWWNWPESKIKQYSVYFDNPAEFIKICYDNGEIR